MAGAVFGEVQVSFFVAGAVFILTASSICEDEPRGQQAPFNTYGFSFKNTAVKKG